MKLWTVIPAALLLSACLSHPPPSPAPYRAIGQEPGWTLIIDERDLTFIPAGGQPIRQPKPQAIVGIAGEIYQTARIGVNIVHAPCNDVMSGQAYRDRVQVDVDGKRYEGCGGDQAAPAGLAGTQWRVESINGRPTPAQGQYYVRFETDRIAAKFGCNSMSGPYQLEGPLLTVGQLVMTRMACPDMRYEQLAAGIMGSRLVTRFDRDRLILSNPPSEIVLRRTY